MNPTVNNIKQRLSLREPLAEALEVVAKLSDKLALKKPANSDEYDSYLKEQLLLAKEVCPHCKDFERDFPSFAFSIATGIGKTRLMGACIAYLYLKKVSGISSFLLRTLHYTRNLSGILAIHHTRNMYLKDSPSLYTTHL